MNYKDALEMKVESLEKTQNKMLDEKKKFILRLSVKFQRLY